MTVYCAACKEELVLTRQQENRIRYKKKLGQSSFYHKACVPLKHVVLHKSPKNTYYERT